ncbi:pilus assembly PilX family protein [Caldimonas caldifontis]|uniref:pilus assembly PilX family protein n=1 Tax=Caldimonas caldifontis TaxID=1452508 RepID=UPI0011B026BD|nr:PilX N-terminal domain-containing pilus assembly protein [Caldimonas caldifontis]
MNSLSRPLIVRRQLGANRSQNRGVVLVVALILLVVIGVSSAVAIRSALFSDLVSHNMRAQNTAMQAAELALRWCEQQALAQPVPPGFQVQPVVNFDEADRWNNAANWAVMANTVPAAVLGGEVNYVTPPQCIVERVEFPSLSDKPRPELAYQVTARGFSPDFQRVGGNSAAGSEVWLQSIIRQF